MLMLTQEHLTNLQENWFTRYQRSLVNRVQEMNNSGIQLFIQCRQDKFSFESLVLDK